MSDIEAPKGLGRLLLIDDDVELCGLIRTYLKSDGFDVQAMQDPEAAIRRNSAEHFDLVLLDVGLPRIGGFDVLRRIRSESTIPIMMLTARGQEVDRIVGFELGADDYLPKPFNPRELSARIQAILRRSRPPTDGAASNQIVVGDINLNVGARTVRRGGRAVELTAVEFTLLELLLRGAGRVVPRDDLFMQVLGRREMPDDRSMDTHISNLRKKLGHKTGDIERIKTIRGIGYVYAAPG
jgi:two-component system response regulator CpxR